MPPIVLKNCASVLTPCLVKLFLLFLSISTFSSYRKYAYIQPVPKKGDRSNLSNYRPIALLSCLSKPFETILNMKIFKHVSASNLNLVRQYVFRNGCSAVDLLPFLTNCWSFSLSRFRETFTIALDMSKALERAWHKSLLSKLPSFGFYPSLCTFISSFILGQSFSAIVDGHCYTPKSINSGVPQSFSAIVDGHYYTLKSINSGVPQVSVLSPTLFLLFINDLSITNCPVQSTVLWR